MLGWLRGNVVVRNPAAGLVIVEAQGIGWELHVSIQTLAGVPEEGKEVVLFVHTNVREDAIQLFGFADAWEKQLFRMLTSVPKVGPKNAIAVLGGFPVRELVECIAARESAKLVKIPGIGGKTAEQIVLTLHDKMPAVIELMRIAGGQAPVQTELPAEPLECTAFWEPDGDGKGCQSSRLDHVFTHRSPSSIGAHGPCETDGCSASDRCPAFHTWVSDHCPVTVEF